MKDEDEWIMPVRKGLEWTFDTAAEAYERMRPGYPMALYDDLFKMIPLDETSRALEIGIGGGQATLPVLKTGCQVTAVEYGKNLTELCREKFRKSRLFYCSMGNHPTFTSRFV